MTTATTTVRPLLPAYVVVHLQALALAHGTTVEALAVRLLAEAAATR